MLHLLVSNAIGLIAARRVKNTLDYANAGRALPLYIVVATYFGSEAVLDIPASFVKDGLGGIIDDPFGASMWLIAATLQPQRRDHRPVMYCDVLPWLGVSRDL